MELRGRIGSAVGSGLMLGYSLALTAVLGVSAPYWLARMGGSGRYRAGFWGRLGRVPAALREAVAGKSVVWLHAVSVGEVLAATRLIAELEQALGAGWVIVVSTTTATGQALARERFGGMPGGSSSRGGAAASERVFPYPLDFAWAVRAYLRALRPSMLVLMESELWPRMLVECRRAGVPVAVVNARVSDRSFARGVKVRAVWGGVLRRIGMFLAQSEEDGRRLVAIGARADRVRVVGNLKYDVLAPQQSRVAGLIEVAAAGRPIVVGGSTLSGHPPEESSLIAAQQGIEAARRPLLVLAPRKPDRFAVVYSMAKEFPTLRASEMLAGRQGSDAHSLQMRSTERARVEIIVLDTIGDLAAVYGIADVAFVGGSLIRRGGHNPLEPARFAVPVVMGPSYENFRDVVEKMRDAEGIRIVPDESGLATAIMHLLTDRDAARAMGQRGRRVFEEQQGATGRTVATLVEMIRAGAGSEVSG